MAKIKIAELIIAAVAAVVGVFKAAVKLIGCLSKRSKDKKANGLVCCR